MRTVVVTGAGGAIGEALAHRLLKAGAAVTGVDARPFAERLLRQRRFNPVRLGSHQDMTNPSVLGPMLLQGENAIHKLDGLACVSGGNPPGSSDNTNYASAASTPPAVFEQQFAFNLSSAVAPVNVLMPALVRARGAIVLTSSVNGIVGIGEAPYSCAKAALHSLAQNLATSHGPEGVRTNSVALGTVASPAIWSSALARDPAILEKIGRRIPRRRVGTPDEAAAVLDWLCSEESQLINGACIVADGGWTVAAGTSRDGARSWFDD